MKTACVLVGFVSVALATSCGGRVSTEDDTNDPQATRIDGGEVDSGRSPGFGDSELEKCEGELAPGEPCDWFIETTGKCYGTKEQACACICPQDRDSTCVSGFYNGPNGRTRVSCF